MGNRSARIPFVFVVMVVALLMGPRPVLAQGGTGHIEGTVRDGQGGAVRPTSRLF